MQGLQAAERRVRSSLFPRTWGDTARGSMVHSPFNQAVLRTVLGPMTCAGIAVAPPSICGSSVSPNRLTIRVGILIRYFHPARWVDRATAAFWIHQSSLIGFRVGIRSSTARRRPRRRRRCRCVLNPSHHAPLSQEPLIELMQNMSPKVDAATNKPASYPEQPDVEWWVAGQQNAVVEGHLGGWIHAWMRGRVQET